MSNGRYTWEDVMLGVDKYAEGAREDTAKRDIVQVQEDEANAAASWSLGLSILGAAIFGPAGYLIGKKAGEWGADYAHDWESMEVGPGKFDKEAGRQFNRDIAKAAKDQTKGQIVDTLVDLGTAYVMSGGMTAEPGEWDPTTFGSGEAEWSLFGKGTPGTPAGDPIYWSDMPGAEPYISPAVPASEDYVAPLFKGGGESAVERIKGVDRSGGTKLQNLIGQFIK